MSKKLTFNIILLIGFLFIVSGYDMIQAESSIFKESIHQSGILKSTDSNSTLKVGDKAPEFSLQSIGGLELILSTYLEKKNVVISFIPAAWSPVCSLQWPEYNKSKAIFDENDAILIGISVDNTPTLHSWAKNMCDTDGTIWFPVLSDFYPHGAVAKKYGVLRSDGLSERALFVIDKKGVIQYIDIHDINKQPPILELEKALKGLKN